MANPHDSPAARHRARCLSVSIGDEYGGEPVEGYAMMMTKLESDKRRLKGIQSRARKVEVKKELLPDYDAWIDGALLRDCNFQDDVLMTLMVWHFDTASISRGLDIAAFALSHGLNLPGHFQRTLSCLIAEEVADLALSTEGAIAFEDLHRAFALTEGEDMPDEVRAKLMKAIGLSLEHSDPISAYCWLDKAYTYDRGVGVKKDLTRIGKAMQSLAKT